MSFQIQFRKHELSPRLRALSGKLTDLRPSLEAAGLQIVSITQRSFRDASLRAAPWAPKADGSPATLIQSGTLLRSIRITKLLAASVAVGTDRIYAALQQFGGEIKPVNAKVLVWTTKEGKKVFAKRVKVPPRPFFPITPDGKLTSLAQTKVKQAILDSLA